MQLTVDIEKKIGHFHLRSRFSTEEGRFALLGACGCGKTQTLRCIAGIERPDRGRILLGDRVLFDSEKKINVPARDRGIGYLFQNYALFPNMTVQQNVFCMAKDRDYAERLLERFCLTDVAGQYPAELSGGQGQRTALARMLAVRPKAILLDEPLSALDNYMRTRMEHEILDILEEFNGPSVLVTHDRNEAYRMADRIGVMDDGTVVEVQERQPFFDRPKTVAAARLTGCKNISGLERRKDGSFFAADWGILVDPGNARLPEEASHIGYRAHYFIYEGGPDDFVSDDSASVRSGRDGDPRRGKIDQSMMEEAFPKNTSPELSVTQGTNRFDCVLQRVIEDTFSVVICFRQKGMTLDSPDALLTWIVGKDAWESVKGNVLSGRFTLRLDPEHLMFLQS